MMKWMHCFMFCVRFDVDEIECKNEINGLNSLDNYINRQVSVKRFLRIKMGFFKEFFTEIAIRVKNPGHNKYCHPKYNEFVPRELPNPVRKQPVYPPVYTPQPPVYTPRQVVSNVVVQRQRVVSNKVIQPKQVAQRQQQDYIQPKRQVAQQDYIQPKQVAQRQRDVPNDYIQPKRQRVQPDLRGAWLLD